MTSVDLYCANLETDPDRVWELEGFLSMEERARAARFRFSKDRRHFVVCRGTLRELLGRHTGLDPADLNFSYNFFGKPELAGSDVRFSVSHSHGLAVYAIARGGDVGVDVERIDPKFACEKIPERFFSPHEVATLRALPVSLQTEAFFLCWTRKEAYVKALGLGLSLPLTSFDVTLTPGEPAVLLRGAGSCSMQSWTPEPGYVGALAAYSM